MQSESFPKMLVIDDEFTILGVFKFFMDRNDYTCFYASDGRSALDIMEKEKPELIFIDLKLDEEDGLELCQIIRQKHGSGKIVAMSGHVNAMIIEECKNAGFDAFISKPLRFADLNAFVKRNYGCHVSL